MAYPTVRAKLLVAAAALAIVAAGPAEAGHEGGLSLIHI